MDCIGRFPAPYGAIIRLTLTHTCGHRECKNLRQYGLNSCVADELIGRAVDANLAEMLTKVP